MRLEALAPGSAEHEAAAALLQLADVAVQAADLLREHPEPAVRRAAAVLAARAYPLLSLRAAAPSPEAL